MDRDHAIARPEYNTGISAQPRPGDAGEVPRALDVLEREVSALNEALDRLVGKLHPVRNMRDTDTSPSAPYETYGAPIACRIQDVTRSVENMMGWVSLVAREVEL